MEKLDQNISEFGKQIKILSSETHSQDHNLICFSLEVWEKSGIQYWLICRHEFKYEFTSKTVKTVCLYKYAGSHYYDCMEQDELLISLFNRFYLTPEIQIQ